MQNAAFLFQVVDPAARRIKQAFLLFRRFRIPRDFHGEHQRRERGEKRRQIHGKNELQPCQTHQRGRANRR